MYEITKYSYDQAKKLGVDIKPSTNKKKKIDVFKNDKKIASIGASGYGDYPTFLNTKGKEFADKKRDLYRSRHASDLNNKSGNGFWASKILW
jgi:hypothetical protein